MKPLVTSILIYMLLIISIYSFKPKICFEKDGKMKSFGIGKNKTPFTFLSISIILGIFSLIISTVYMDYIIPQTEEVIEQAKNIAQEALDVLDS